MKLAKMINSKGGIRGSKDMALTYEHSRKQALAYAKTAMSRIEKEQLPPTPDIFELWYVFYARINPELNKAIDILTSKNQQLTMDRCQEIFYRFLSPHRDEEAIQRAGTQLNSTLKDMSGAVSEVRSATSQYSGALKDVSGKIKPGMNSEDFTIILENILKDTDQMVAHNRNLEEKLDQSAEKMKDLQRDLELIRKEALTDGLTGLSNRKAFDVEIRRVIGESRNDGKSFSLLMMDIDHFKAFNDNFGHQVGDQVLRLVARTMVEGVKGRDIAARYGGEEFAIILPDTPLRAGMAVAEHLREAVATKDVVNRNTGEKLGRITLSAGVAEFQTDEDRETLIERADAALYTAKHNGRNQIAAAPSNLRKTRD